MSTPNFRCQYCSKGPFASEQAVNHHIALKPNCKRKQAEAIMRLVSERDPFHDPYDPELAGRGSSSPSPTDNELAELSDGDDFDASNFDVNLHVREFDTHEQLMGLPVDEMEVDAGSGERYDDDLEDNGSDLEDSEPQKSSSSPCSVPYPGAGRLYEKAICSFERRRLKELEKNEKGWGLFKDEKHHQLAEWILTSGLSNKKLDELLATEVVSPFTLQETV